MAPSFSRELEPHLVGRGLARAGPGAPRGRALLAPWPCRSPPSSTVAALAAQDVLGEIEREAEGVVKLEGDLAGERLDRIPMLRGLLLEQLEAALERLAEARFLEAAGSR